MHFHLRLTLKNALPIAALVALLKRDRLGFAQQAEDSGETQADRLVAEEYMGLIDRLEEALQAGKSIDLEIPRSTAAALWDGGAETVGGYLLCLVRDEYNSVGTGEGWERLADLS